MFLDSFFSEWGFKTAQTILHQDGCQILKSPFAPEENTFPKEL
jgi:hypothetical protein